MCAIKPASLVDHACGRPPTRMGHNADPAPTRISRNGGSDDTIKQTIADNDASRWVVRLGIDPGGTHGQFAGGSTACAVARAKRHQPGTRRPWQDAVFRYADVRRHRSVLCVLPFTRSGLERRSGDVGWLWRSAVLPKRTRPLQCGESQLLHVGRTAGRG